MKFRRPGKSQIVQGVFIVSLCILSIEVTLRAQQEFGPLLDLKSVDRYFLGVNEWSQVLHHVNRPGRDNVLFTTKERFEDLVNHAFVREYDEQGIRVNHLMPRLSEDQEEVKILFMGDSFIQGYDDQHTIPRQAYLQLKRSMQRDIPLSFYNAGTSSYSPLLFIVQAKLLIPWLKPDFIVIDIDETDFENDQEYRSLVVRDSTNSVVAVLPPTLVEQLQPLMDNVVDSDLFLIRFVKFLDFARRYDKIVLEQLARPTKDEYVTKIYNGYRLKKRKPNPEASAMFRQNVDELARTLIELMNGHDKILFVHHPHAMHVTPDSDGEYWPSLVAQIVSKICTEHNIPFYDATNDIKARTEKAFEEYYWPTDMHFNFEGIEVYGALVGQAMEPLLTNNSIDQ